MREARLIGVTHLFCHRCKRSGGLRRADCVSRICST